MKNFTCTALVLVAFALNFKAQTLCTPSFLNGCGNWKNNYIVVGGLDWTFDGVDCTNYDYTADYTATVSAGVATYMEVNSGNWCGCSVWVDFNTDGQFDDSENLYHAGNGGTETNSFVFDITVPPTTLNGTYVMRVIASWGSDGYTPSTNGSGGCGDYQYGGFNDFSLVVENGAASSPELETTFALYPNPANESLTIKSDVSLQGEYQITDLRGTAVQSGKLDATQVELDIASLQAGMYVLSFENSSKKHTFVKH